MNSHEQRADVKLGSMKSKKQIKLEQQGCKLGRQESLDKHEIDAEKPCHCGRPIVSIPIKKIIDSSEA